MDDTSEKSSGTLIFGYNHSLSRRLRLGLSTSYTHYEILHTYESGKTVEYQDYFITPMARIDFNWINRRKIMLYSGIGSGICYYWSNITRSNTSEKETDSEHFYAFQLNALGIRFGDKLGGFLELGFGYNGFINGGLSLKL